MCAEGGRDQALKPQSFGAAPQEKLEKKEIFLGDREGDIGSTL